MSISIKKIQTPLGDMIAGANNDGLWFLEFSSDDKLREQLDRLGKELNVSIEFGEHHYLNQLETELGEYFEKQRMAFTLPLYLSGTVFQKSVWNLLTEIPYGKTWTYKQQALKLGKLSAIRAVATTNGQNRHAIVIPCHRVIGSNGSLTGYAGGLDKKAWLLKFESNQEIQAPELPFE